MTKKTKRNMPTEAPTPVVVEHKLPAPPMASYLEKLRNEVLDRKGRIGVETRNAAQDVERTIADLEELQNEIAATIGLLKSTRR
jgi:hypothetical protein